MPYTHPLTGGPRFSWEAWGSIFTVTLKRNRWVEDHVPQHPEPPAPELEHQEVGILPLLLFPQGGQLGLGVQGFQEDPKRK